MLNRQKSSVLHTNLPQIQKWIWILQEIAAFASVHIRGTPHKSDVFRAGTITILLASTEQFWTLPNESELV
jgi:hypothetical protein